ncbi:hypothetical protein GCM10010124_24410 [Pilimelia terevasa]|uniref:Uncharacterized protein n=1 Tax=Pilimelia terevasa TaxID=53372 RepID=A0A8J3BLS5_9ACTN|nr:YhjD/YihY/BrkB family envelope integrity protein [Pilimelia terevasa]GGK30768.1 hypothetical protein GCM10010124_24410 [Pilimelia terevasa]
MSLRLLRALVRVRRRWSWCDHLWRAAVRYDDVLAGRLAAAIAYYGFFACFALALLAYSLLGYLLAYDADVFRVVDDFLGQNLPWLEPQAIEAGRGHTGIVGAVGLVVTGVGWIETIRSSQRQVHGVPQQPGNLVLRWLVDLGLLAGLIVLVGVSMTVFYALESLVRWLGGPSVSLTALGWLSAAALNVLLAAALLGGVARVRLSRRRLLPAVALVAVGITLLNTAGQLVIAYVRHNPAYSVVTGAVGLLLYLYLFNQILLFGAAWAATAGGRRPKAADR